MTNRAEKPGGGPRQRVTALLDMADGLQQRNRVLAVAVATWKKFGDDQAGNLAALIAYYAFASLFPLLLVAVTILDLVVRNNPQLRHQLLSSTLGKYPVIGPQLAENAKHGLSKTGIALVIGLVLTLYAALGVAAAMQNAMNTVWGVPQFRRSGFPWSKLRSLGLMLVVGPGQIITISLSSVAGGAGHLGGVASRLVPVAVSLVLNVGLFWLGFRLATSVEVATRDLRLSAILAAVAWQVLQVLGGYFLAHQAATHSAYGVFGVVLGLLAWFYLQAQITLYVVELNVVRVRGLWPRSIAPPPLSDADIRSYQMYAEASQRRPEIDIQVRQLPPEASQR
jgi:membrane protein